jgi:hypothetical protein
MQLIPQSDSDMLRALVPSAAMSVPLDVQAPCYFMSNFTLASQPTARGYFDFLQPLVKTEPSDSHFSLAFSAVALASLANRPHARGSNLFSQAANQYTKALRAVNLALQSPQHQKTDQTLAAILMLGFFEVSYRDRPQSTVKLTTARPYHRKEPLPWHGILILMAQFNLSR